MSNMNKWNFYTVEQMRVISIYNMLYFKSKWYCCVWIGIADSIVMLKCLWIESLMSKDLWIILKNVGLSATIGLLNAFIFIVCLVYTNPSPPLQQQHTFYPMIQVSVIFSIITERTDSEHKSSNLWSTFNV